VTGGATGMGRAIALALAEAGADVAIGSLVETARGGVVPGQNVYTPTLDEMTAARDAIAAHGGRVLALPLDVCSNESVDAFHAATVEAFGRIDILVNAAGSSTRHVITDHPDDLWQRMLETNLTGAYRTIKRCMAGMIERKWGRIINIASTAASVGYVAHSAYCASKSGLLGLTRCVALEGAPHGISCNAISPGWVDTPQGRGRGSSADADRGLRRRANVPRADRGGHSAEAIHPTFRDRCRGGLPVPGRGVCPHHAGRHRVGGDALVIALFPIKDLRDAMMLGSDSAHVLARKPTLGHADWRPACVLTRTSPATELKGLYWKGIWK